MVEKIISLGSLQSSETPTPEELKEAKKYFNCFELVIDPRSLNELKAQYRKNPSFKLIVAGNHTTWADGLPSAMLAEYLINEINNLEDGVEKINGFNIPVAYSMETGNQGSDMKKWLKFFSILCSEKGLSTISVTREKDSKLYGIIEKKFGSLKKILKGFKDHYGLMEYVEGNMNGGRWINNDPNQGVNGVGIPDPNNATDFFVDKFIQKKEEFGVLVFAIDGSYKLFSPVLKKVTIPDKKIKAITGKLLTRKYFENSPLKPSELVLQETVPLLSQENKGIVYRVNLENTF